MPEPLSLAVEERFTVPWTFAPMSARSIVGFVLSIVRSATREEVAVLVAVAADDGQIGVARGRVGRDRHVAAEAAAGALVERRGGTLEQPVVRVDAGERVAAVRERERDGGAGRVAVAVVDRAA